MPRGRLADPLGQGTPCGGPDTPRSTTYLTFRPVWRVKRPSNSTKQVPLRSYRRELRNGVRIVSIRCQHFKKSPENQGKRGEKLHRQGKTGPGSSPPEGSRP